MPIPPGRRSSGRPSCERDDRAFDADFARPTVEDHRDLAVQVGFDVRGGRRRHVAEPVCRGRGDAFAADRSERHEQRLRHRVRGHAQSDAVLSAGDRIADVWRARQDQRQRSRPERFGERLRARRHVTRPSMDVRRVRYVHDQRMIGGTTLHREDPAHRVSTRCVGTEPVHGLGRKRDELAIAQRGSPPGPRPPASATRCRRRDRSSRPSAAAGAIGSVLLEFKTLQSWRAHDPSTIEPRRVEVVL